jgi:hypothetical protein
MRFQLVEGKGTIGSCNVIKCLGAKWEWCGMGKSYLQDKEVVVVQSKFPCRNVEGGC